MKKIGIMGMVFLCGVFFIIYMVSCRHASPDPLKRVYDFQSVNIEGCEYFMMTTSYHYNVLTHKGNCNNPIHRCQ